MERRLPNIVKDFLERAILPEINKNSSLSTSCQYFLSLLGQDIIDLPALEAIVNTFPSQLHQHLLDQPKPQQMFAKKK